MRKCLNYITYDHVEDNQRVVMLLIINSRYSMLYNFKLSYCTIPFNFMGYPT